MLVICLLVVFDTKLICVGMPWLLLTQLVLLPFQSVRLLRGVVPRNVEKGGAALLALSL